MRRALQLSDAEREQLVEALAVNLYGKDLGEEWEVEIQNRVADLDAGRVAQFESAANLAEVIPFHDQEAERAVLKNPL